MQIYKSPITHFSIKEQKPWVVVHWVVYTIKAQQSFTQKNTSQGDFIIWFHSDSVIIIRKNLLLWGGLVKQWDRSFRNKFRSYHDWTYQQSVASVLTTLSALCAGRLNVGNDELDEMMKEASGPINFTIFLAMFGEKLKG